MGVSGAGGGIRRHGHTGLIEQDDATGRVEFAHHIVSVRHRLVREELSLYVHERHDGCHIVLDGSVAPALQIGAQHLLDRFHGFGRRIVHESAEAHPVDLALVAGLLDVVTVAGVLYAPAPTVHLEGGYGGGRTAFPVVVVSLGDLHQFGLALPLLADAVGPAQGELAGHVLVASQAAAELLGRQVKLQELDAAAPFMVADTDDDHFARRVAAAGAETNAAVALDFVAHNSTSLTTVTRVTMVCLVPLYSSCFLTVAFTW